MNLAQLIKEKGVSQRQFARDLGYNSPGLVGLVISGKAAIPQDDIPKWADALQLEDEEREQFIAEASADALPAWVLDDIKDLRARNSLLLDLVAHRDADPPVLPADKKLTADQRLAELANLRRVNRALLDELEIARGQRKRPRGRGVDAIPDTDA